MNLLGDFIKSYRKEHSLSLRNFAKLCDISHTHIDSIERGTDPRTGKTVKVSNDTIVKLSNATGMPPDYLFNLSIGIDPNKKEITTIAAHRSDGTETNIDTLKLKELIRQVLQEESKK